MRFAQSSKVRRRRFGLALTCYGLSGFSVLPMVIIGDSLVRDPTPGNVAVLVLWATFWLLLTALTRAWIHGVRWPRGWAVVAGAVGVASLAAWPLSILTDLGGANNKTLNHDVLEAALVTLAMESVLVSPALLLVFKVIQFHRRPDTDIDAGLGPLSPPKSG